MIDIVGIAGIAISMVAYIPQVVHLVRQHCSEGVSTRAWSMWLVGALLVAIVAVERRDLVFIILQLSTCGSALLILFLTRRYRGTPCASHARLVLDPIADTTVIPGPPPRLMDRATSRTSR